MPDVDAILRDALHQHADDAPAAGRLLSAVHERSRRKHRRRVTVAAAAMVLAVGAVPAALVGVARLTGPAGRTDGPAAPGAPDGGVDGRPGPSASPTPRTGPRTPPPAPTPPAPPASTAFRIRLAKDTYTAPPFPFRPGFAPIGGLKDPVVTLDGGVLTAYYEAKDPVRGAFVVVTVWPRRPTFTAPADRAGPVSEKTRQVRGYRGTLRTVHVSPANRLSLYWPESASRWVRVDTDDTLTDDQVVRLADELRPATVPVVVPLRFAESPAGMVLDTQTVSAVRFRAPGKGDAALSCALSPRRRLTGRTIAVGRYRGTLVRTGSGATLTVALTDWRMTLTVAVPARLEITDAELVRFAIGVELTERAEPGS